MTTTETESLADWVRRTAPTWDADTWTLFFSKAKRICATAAQEAAMLAELDRIAGELGPDAREALASASGDACSVATGAELSQALLIEVRAPQPHDFTCVGRWRPTPLGRAVLRRHAEKAGSR